MCEILISEKLKAFEKMFQKQKDDQEKFQKLIIEKMEKLQPTSSIPKIWLTEPEVAVLLNVSRRQIYNMRVTGKLGASCVNGKQLYKLQDINNILEKAYNKPFKTK